MNILGIYNGHDSSAAITVDGKISAVIQEERLNRIKHYAGLPYRSVNFCLTHTGLSAKDLDYIAIPRLRSTIDIDALFNIQSSGELAQEEFGKPTFSDKWRSFLIKSARFLMIGSHFGFPEYQKRFVIGSKTKIIHLEHHLAHAASAFYTSGFERSLVVTADGAGDAVSATVWLGEKGLLRPITKIGRDGSLGFFYNVVTEALGWQVSEGEGKTMGLAPYGNTKKTFGKLNFCLPVFEDGKLAKPHNFGFPKLWLESGVYHWHFDESAKVKELINKYGRENIAAEAQRCLEEQMINFIKPYLDKYQVKTLAVSGGDFLNVKMNQKILETCDLERFYVYPDAGDSGVSLGACLYVDQTYNKKHKPSAQITNLYWGTEYSDKEILDILNLRKIKYIKYSKKELTKHVAKLLSSGKIVGWFQGRMEVGPRALGNRSILMDPRKAESKDIINNRVKFREGFRPFTPSMTLEASKKFIEGNPIAPFMIISFNSKNGNLIPAVVHVDGTLRPHTVDRKENTLYYELISEFGKITKIPVLLNTSFNIKGEPIVESPIDALKCFYDTGLDYLVLGPFIIEKEK